MRAVLLVALLMSCSAPALALYKCESGGKITYSDQPCAQGKALGTFEPSTATESAYSPQQLAADKARVRLLEQTRHRREDKEELEQRQASRAAAKHRKNCQALALKQRWAQEDARQAAGKAVEKARIRASRSAEKYQLSCGK